MYDLTGFYIWLGVGLLLVGLAALVKLGLWVWVMTRVFHRPPHVAPAPEPTAPAPSGSAASSIKAWLGVIATALGIVTTIVGLMKECGPAKSEVVREPVQIAPTPVMIPATPSLGSMCCTYAGSCPMLMAAPTETVCTCMDMFGNVAQGTVCQ